MNTHHAEHISILTPMQVCMLCKAHMQVCMLTSLAVRNYAHENMMQCELLHKSTRELLQTLHTCKHGILHKGISEHPSI